MSAIKRVETDNTGFPTVHELYCPVYKAKRLYMGGCLVEFDEVVMCGVCGSIYSEITFNKCGKVLKAIKIGERKYKPSLLSASANEPLTMELGEPYLEMLLEPMVYEVGANG